MHVPFDAIVLLSFGGPEAPEEVMPFLRRVTAGRGVPDERLEAVAEHYYARGGRSPINDTNRALLAALRAQLHGRGITVPLVWANRNAEPFLPDVLREVASAGARHVRVLTTSAYPSYSGCRQYREDLAQALDQLAAEGIVLTADLVPHAWNTDGFVEANADAVLTALAGLESSDEQAELLFVTHSIPTAMAQTAGAPGEPGQYERTHHDVARRVSERVRSRGGRVGDYELVYCSRSGPPQQPWLEPDINDRLAELAPSGARSAQPNVVASPIGFVSDHMEVVYDLDTEAAATAVAHGLAFARAATAGTHPAFVSALADLIVGPPKVCPTGCCANLRIPDKRAAAGEDWVPSTVSPGDPRFAAAQFAASQFAAGQFAAGQFAAGQVPAESATRDEGAQPREQVR